MRRCVPLLLVTLALLAGCRDPGERLQLRTDMYSQPSVGPQENPRPPAPNTVPVSGAEPSVKDPRVADQLKNPVARTPVVLDAGKRLFQTYCLPCHGPDAKGDGLVAPKFMKPPDITAEKYKQVTDGYIYSIIRHGHTTMPPYGEATTATERWQIVHYLRKLQGQ